MAIHESLEHRIDHPALIQERAVVIGCGIGGLAAAAALRNHYEEVVILERDTIPDNPESRRGVPQDNQLHNLISCAQINLEKLIPGFLDSLREAGAGEASVADETHVYELGIRMPERDLGLRLMSAYRPVIEHVARKKLQEDGQVAIKGLVRATGLQISRSGGLRGVTVDTEEGAKTIPASIVVDATGSASPVHRWLEDNGQQMPPIETAKINQWYVSTVFKRPPNYVGDNDFWLSFPNPPHTRGGLVSPIGDDLWYVSVSGRNNDQPPRTVEEVKAYVTDLEDEASISKLIMNSVPQGKPNLFRKVTATIRRYDLVEHPLPGVIPIGDSIASLNPLYGQGMSVAAWQASELDTLLGDHRQGLIGLHNLTSRYLDRALTVAQEAWDLGEVVDQTISGSPDIELEQVRLRYRALGQLVEADPALHRLYVSIWHLIEPAKALQDPEILSRLEENVHKLNI